MLTFTADEKLVLEAINTIHGVLDSLVKLRKEIGPESNAFPRWALEPSERALRNHPDVLNDLLKALAEGEEFIQ